MGDLPGQVAGFENVTDKYRRHLQFHHIALSVCIGTSIQVISTLHIPTAWVIMKGSFALLELDKSSSTVLSCSDGRYELSIVVVPNRCTEIIKNTRLTTYEIYTRF